jgi:FkbM family methyltransferase
MEVKIRDFEIKFVHLDLTSSYETEVLDYIDSIKEGEVFYDVGACLGYFSLYAAQKKLEVFSFEVDPQNYFALSNNTKKNNFEGRIFNVGISDGSQTEQYLFCGQPWFGGHHKTLETKNFVGHPDIQNKNYKKIKVKVKDLDSFIIDNNLPYPNHIKVDVDGSEYDFIKGASVTLQKSKTIMIELYKNSDKYEEIINTLKFYGFEIFREKEIAQPNCVGLFNIWFEKCGKKKV